MACSLVACSRADHVSEQCDEFGTSVPSAIKAVAPDAKLDVRPEIEGGNMSTCVFVSKTHKTVFAVPHSCALAHSLVDRGGDYEGFAYVCSLPGGFVTTVPN
jgi:hypothetical protein